MNYRKVVAVALAFLLQLSAYPYKSHTKGHKEITTNAKRIKQDLHGSESCWQDPLFNGSLNDFLTQSSAEDWSSPDLGFWQPWRPFYHFYNPATHDGIVAWGSAVTRMSDLQKEARDTLKDVVCALKRHDSGAASEAMRRFIRIMGSIAHIAEDLTTPEHSLNVPHENVVSNETIWAMPLDADYDQLMQFDPVMYSDGGREAFFEGFGVSDGSVSVIEAMANGYATSDYTSETCPVSLSVDWDTEGCAAVAGWSASKKGATGAYPRLGSPLSTMQ